MLDMFAMILGRFDFVVTSHCGNVLSVARSKLFDEIDKM